MNSRSMIPFLVFASVLVLTSCSGQKTPCTENCGGGGNASVSLTLYDSPLSSTNVLSFTLPIAGITLTTSSGTQVSVFKAATSASVDMMQLQTDSALVNAAASVPADTYKSVSVTVLSPTGVFINTTSSTVSGCASGNICAIPEGNPTTITAPLTLTLTSNQSQWIGLAFNVNNALTTTSGIGFNLQNANVLTTATTPRTGLPSGAADTIQNFNGTVTAYTAGSTITVASGMNGASIKATLNSSTVYNMAPVSYSRCTGAAEACIAVGSTVSLNVNLASSGMMTATEVDVLDASSSNVNEVQGIIYPTTQAGVLGMVLEDMANGSSNSTLASATFGAAVALTLSGSASYSVDTNTLTTPLPAPVGFSGPANLLGGQVVRAQIINIASGTNGTITATANNLLLRFSQLTGPINTIAGNTFTITPPNYFNYLNSSLSLTPIVQTYPNYTAFDGVTGMGDPNFKAGASFSISALYLDSSPPFQAAKVRLQ